MSLYKYKFFFISILLILLFSPIYLIEKSCEIKRLFDSGKVLGFYSTFEDCKNSLTRKVNNKINLIILKFDNTNIKKIF